ncbi:MAG: 2-C-methyl-D-erythritol 2,4-cyclodiphosphate synthase [Fimbriimonadaceae bacterium]
MRVFAIILAAGSGERMGFDKVNYVVRGKPLWRYSFDTFLSHPEVDGVGLVSNTVTDVPEAAFVVPGGTSRTESSRVGFAASPEWADIILVHDGARPLVSHQVITDVIRAVELSGAASPVIPVNDTIKQVTTGNIQTLTRADLFATQTPQGALREHFQTISTSPMGATDDLALMEANGIRPALTQGDKLNFKVTTMDDFLKLGALLGHPETRTGLGYDIHSFSTDSSRQLMLGGVHFPAHPALDGHSDADVVIHALVDALLGAASLGDIGVHFPNSDPRWKDAPSIDFLLFSRELLANGGWEIVNVDIAVVAETPKIMVRSSEILQILAESLQIDVSRVSIKATTNERLGAIGRSEGIAAFATATIRQRF